MARPPRCRRICSEPQFNRFAPCGSDASTQILLTVDEFETIRLIDYEGKTQAQCAQSMDVARTTVTDIYERARTKIADCIINGKTLCIAGGNYVLCDGQSQACCKPCSKAHEPNATHRPINKKRKDNTLMKIAVTYDKENIFQHFGRTEEFKIYEVEDGKVVSSQVISTNGNGHGALAGILHAWDIDTLICGGIGAGAQNALANAGIKLYGGISGNADKAVEDLLAGTLAYNPDFQCNHHDHEHHGGSCHHHGGTCHN